MDASRFALPLLAPAEASARMIPDPSRADAVAARDAAPDGAVRPLPSRLPAWLLAVAARLRDALGDFPDAVWLATPAGLLAAERDEQGDWHLCEAGAGAGAIGARSRLPMLHEVPDAASDPAFDDHPATACWPMARRLCRIGFDDGPGGSLRSEMMLVGSLPGRLGDAHAHALLEWIPAAGAMLAMVADAAAG